MANAPISSPSCVLAWAASCRPCCEGSDRVPNGRALVTASRPSPGRRSHRANLRRGGALRTLDRLVLDLLAFLEALEAAALNLAVVGKEVLAAVSRSDEAEAFRVVEPLHGAFSHFNSFLDIRAKPDPEAGHERSSRGIDGHWQPRRARM